MESLLLNYGPPCDNDDESTSDESDDESGGGLGEQEVDERWCVMRGRPAVRDWRRFCALERSIAHDESENEAEELDESNSTMDELSVCVLEPRDATAKGLGVWPSSITLAEVVWSMRKLIAGNVVVELGAGCGLPSLVAAHVGASRVFLTDKHGDDSTSLDSLAVLRNATRCVASQPRHVSERATVVPLTWAQFDQLACELARAQPQWILASDALYERSAFEPFLATVAFLLRFSHASARCLMVYQVRDVNRSLFHLLHKWHLECERLPIAELVASPAHAHEHSLDLFSLRLRTPS